MTDQTHKHALPWPKWFLISACLSALGGLLLIGIPGALVLEAVYWLQGLFGLQPRVIEGDAAWPTAIMIALLWPLPITPLAILHHRFFPNQTTLNRWLICLASSLLVTVVMTFLWLL